VKNYISHDSANKSTNQRIETSKTSQEDILKNMGNQTVEGPIKCFKMSSFVFSRRQLGGE